MFLKISQCSQKVPVFEPLFNKAEGLKAFIFVKRVFSCKYYEIFKNSLLVEHFMFILLLCDNRIPWTSLGTKMTYFIFLVLLLFSFITLLLESRLHSYLVLVFISKFLVSVTFAGITTVDFNVGINVNYSDWIAKNQKQLQNFRDYSH